jgi:Fe2+ transport system protein FeoA
MKVSRVIRSCVDAAMHLKRRRSAGMRRSSMKVIQLLKRCAGCASRACGRGNKPGSSLRCQKSVSVTQLSNGSSARVVCVQGDGKAAKRLAAMGIVPGAIIVKAGASPLRGPVVLKKGSTQFAIGYAMALRLLVDKIGKQ